MIRHGGSLLLALLGTTCDEVFDLHRPPPEPPELFAGCFQGTTTQPPGTLTIVLEATTDQMLGGCLQAKPNNGMTFNADVTGTVHSDDPTIADLKAMPGMQSWSFTVQRSPAGDAQATRLDVTARSGSPYASISPLAVCPDPTTTCESLAMPQMFVPEVQP